METSFTPLQSLSGRLPVIMFVISLIVGMLVARHLESVSSRRDNDILASKTQGS